MMDSAGEASKQTPLLSPVENEENPERRGEPSSNNNATSNNEQELQFYEPAAVLRVSREVAFGYLILLTGGAVEYKLPTLEEVSPYTQQKTGHLQDHTAEQEAAQSQAEPGGSTLDEESAPLAYAAIVDGNVLHACFGLKATANGSSGGNNAVPTIGSKNNPSMSILCCFPNSSATLDALQLVLPQATKSKLQMQNLVEVLREVMDLHYEASVDALDAADTLKRPLYMQVIQAYIHSFTAIVRYHDTKEHIKGDTKSNKGERRKSDGLIASCINRLNHLFSKPKINPRLERLQQDTLKDIENAFRGLSEDISESLEKTATNTAFTGVSVDDNIVTNFFFFFQIVNPSRSPSRIHH